MTILPLRSETLTSRKGMDVKEWSHVNFMDKSPLKNFLIRLLKLECQKQLKLLKSDYNYTLTLLQTTCSSSTMNNIKQFLKLGVVQLNYSHHFRIDELQSITVIPLRKKTVSLANTYLTDKLHTHSTLQAKPDLSLITLTVTRKTSFT